jgi:hypothetical protein
MAASAGLAKETNDMKIVYPSQNIGKKQENNGQKFHPKL